MRDVRYLDEADHARRALERVGVAKHLVDELAVARVALERDDALVQALEKVLCASSWNFAMNALRSNSTMRLYPLPASRTPAG